MEVWEIYYEMLGLGHKGNLCVGGGGGGTKHAYKKQTNKNKWC